MQESSHTYNIAWYDEHLLYAYHLFRLAYCIIRALQVNPSINKLITNSSININFLLICLSKNRSCPKRQTLLTYQQRVSSTFSRRMHA